MGRGLVSIHRPRQKDEFQIVGVLKRASEVLARIQDGFHAMVKSRSARGLPPTEITCFYEELPLPSVGLVSQTKPKSSPKLGNMACQTITPAKSYSRQCATVSRTFRGSWLFSIMPMT
jgi:hypothetical protein